MRLAAVQMCASTDVADNVKAASAMIRVAAGAGARLIATPEMTHLLQRDPAALRASVRPQADDVGVAAFSTLAAELGVYLLIGSLAILRSDGQIANRSFLFAPDGHIAAQYDKIHLFEANLSEDETYREADSYAAGDIPVMTKVDDVTLGLSICYDLRFPELYRAYGRDGAEIISVPAAFTVATGQAHWEVLLRARAIETGAYILAPAQGGHHADGRRTWGRSMIIAPWGEIVAQSDDDSPGIISAEFDPAAVTSARARVPAWRQI